MDSSSTKTIGFLRTLTLDGYLSSDEVWSLGKFFVRNPECAKAWPGSILAPMLESAFDDEALSQEEMTLMAETIGSIEEEWRIKNPRSPLAFEREIPFSTQSALIPSIDAKFEIPARENESYTVALKEHTCTCSDWQQRKPLPPRHPGKCCKHVAYAFTRTGKVFEPWFQALLDDCFSHARGTNPQMEWLLVELPVKKPALIGGGAGPWCNVYAPAEIGYETYAFNLLQNRWSYDEAPNPASVIERVIRDNFVSLHH